MIDLKAGNSVLSDVKLIIFDKDGTLIDLYQYWSHMISMRANLISKELKLDSAHKENLIYQMGVDRKVLRLRPEGPVGIKKREIVLQAAVDYLATLGFKDTNKICFDIFDKVDVLSQNMLSDLVEPIEGAIQLLQDLALNGCKTAIATTDITERAVLAMNHFSNSANFDLIIGADKVKNSKPDPEMVNIILDSLKIKRSETIIVGDAITDVQMGFTAGLKASIGVLTGITRKKDLLEVTPHVVESVKELKVISGQ